VEVNNNCSPLLVRFMYFMQRRNNNCKTFFTNKHISLNNQPSVTTSTNLDINNNVYSVKCPKSIFTIHSKSDLVRRLLNRTSTECKYVDVARCCYWIYCPLTDGTTRNTYNTFAISTLNSSLSRTLVSSVYYSLH
jgi:hypothetical protein